MRICLISSVHLWVNPRLIKEADWLAARGHDVHVITTRTDRWSDDRDAALLPQKCWTAERINLLRDDSAGRRRWMTSAVRAKVAMRLYATTGVARFGEEAYYRGYRNVLEAARRADADFYIAHTQGALPIAARAAAEAGVRFGFDCEDLLAEEAADGLRSPSVRRAILQIERAYLPRASYVTATSAAMADYLERTYEIRRPFVVRNVFARDEVARVAPPHERHRGATCNLVWISATIGTGRGLDQALEALALLPPHVHLTLVGRMLPAYAPAFRAQVDRLGLAARVTIGPMLDGANVLPSLARFDVGLALDPNDCLNRSLTICNKVFLYLQAGLLVAATDTPGQREVLASEPNAGFLVPAGDAASLAKRLARFVDDRDALTAAQTAAWTAGQERCNWDRDALVFQSALDQATCGAAVARPSSVAAPRQVALL